jgi:alpha-L-rhamnosidase
MPSWLYPITKGATTIWERWNGILPDGSINAGGLESGTEGSGEGMNSFNHYAYGAVVDWIYRNVCGIAPTSPGYQTVAIAPRPQVQLTSSKTTIQSGYGPIGLEWEIVDNRLDGKLEIPFGVEAVFDLLGSENSALVVNAVAIEKSHRLSHGTYIFTLNNPLISR